MRRERWIAASFLAISGLLPIVMSPPIGWIFLQPLAWAPAFAVLMRLRGKRAFLAGWLVGTLANLSVFYWIAETISRFSNLPGVAAFAVLLLVASVFGLYVGAFALGMQRVMRASGSWWPFAVSAWFVSCEFLNPQLFPYLQGVGWYGSPRIFLLSALTGISGVSFLVLLANTIALQAALLRWGGDRKGARSGNAEGEAGFAARSASAVVRNAAIAAGLLIGTFAFTHARLARIEQTELEVERLRVGMIQTNVERSVRHAMIREDPTSVTRNLLALSQEAVERDPEIEVLVWPEGELVHGAEHPRSRKIRAFAQRNEVEIWTGGPYQVTDASGKRHRYNSAYRILPDASVDRRYDKNVLLPFGEFVPFEEQIPLLAKLQGPGRLTAGKELIVYEDGPLRFAFMICYEAILSGYVRDAVREDLDLIVNVTYDGWFGDTGEPYQHLMLAAAQAAQHGIPLIRSTTTGISAVVDARGAFLARSQPYRREVIVAELRPVRVPAPYTKWGDWFAWGCVASSAVLILRGRTAATQQPRPLVP